ncbi:MAG: C39 family peptidase [Bacillaceae bacterium]|nr:C39 family peptidase [Bacillaceae bacterium]
MEDQNGLESADDMKLKGEETNDARKETTDVRHGEDNKPQKEKVLLDVPLIKQNPELKYGCEVTSLAMVLNYAGISADKMQLAKELPKDNDPIKRDQNGNIVEWGDPDEGFVGDITGKEAGYAVFDGPLEELMNQYLPGRTVNLTNQSFDDILKQVEQKKPVVVWTTGDFQLPDRWEAWDHQHEHIETPLDLHAVVLVGYDSKYVYINDPLSGKKQHKVDKQQFMESWESLEKRALSYR